MRKSDKESLEPIMIINGFMQGLIVGHVVATVVRVFIFKRLFK